MFLFLILLVTLCWAMDDPNEHFYHHMWRKMTVQKYDPHSWTPPIWDTTCSFTRDDVHKAMKKYVDVNPKDNVITKEEVKEALSKYLPWYAKPILLLGSPDTIVHDCGTKTQNPVITSKSFQDSATTCLPFKKNWCTVQWFYDNIEAGHLG